jgi:predicted nucleic acid-binding protein
LRRLELLAIIDELLAEMTVVPVAALRPVLAESEIALKDAVASRNGSIRDAHVLALARCVEADVCSTDRDFAGTGVASWSCQSGQRPRMNVGLSALSRLR